MKPPCAMCGDKHRLMYLVAGAWHCRPCLKATARA